MWLQLLLTVAVGAPEDARLCEGPAACRPGEVCVGYTCLSGSERARVERLYRVAVVPPVVVGGSPAAHEIGRALYAHLLRDLEWTRLYDALGMDHLPNGWRLEGVSPAEVRPAAWRAGGFSRVVQVAIVPVGAESARVRLRAVGVERFEVLALPEGDATVRLNDVRAMSARWVNALVGWDTGLPGSVGTRLLGVTEVRRGIKEIAAIDADGQGYRQISHNGSLNLGPAWGPGGRVGWMSYLSGNTDWVVDGAPFSTRPGLNAAGKWSPDGRLLALSVAELGDAELILLDGATGEEHARLTDQRAVDTSPAWSPDGGRLAFVSDRVGGRPQIWILSLGDGDLVQLTREGYNTSPDWSPLGDSIIFTRQGGGGQFAIMRHDLDTGLTRRLTDLRGSAEHPSFSPDGRYIAFELKDARGSRLWVMTADGHGARPIAGDRSFGSPAWKRWP